MNLLAISLMATAQWKRRSTQQSGTYIKTNRAPTKTRTGAKTHQLLKHIRCIPEAWTAVIIYICTHITYMSVHIYIERESTHSIYYTHNSSVDLKPCHLEALKQRFEPWKYCLQWTSNWVLNYCKGQASGLIVFASFLASPRPNCKTVWYISSLWSPYVEEKKILSIFSTDGTENSTGSVWRNALWGMLLLCQDKANNFHMHCGL